VLLSGGATLGGRATSDGVATVYRFRGDELDTAMAAGASQVSLDGNPLGFQQAQEDTE
jgi:hypothetical protein